MTNLSTLFPAVNTFTGDAAAHDLRTGKKAWVDGAEITGSGYFPALMEFDGSTGYYSDTITPSGNAFTVLARIKIPDFASTAGAHIFGVAGAAGTGFRPLLLITGSNYSDVDQRGKIQLFAQSSAPAEICRIISSTSFNTDSLATIFAAYDATAGTAILRINGNDEDDTGHADRTLTTGTLSTSASSSVAIARNAGSAANWVDGHIGFIGYREAYLTNWSDFMHADGTPKPIDQSGWTEFGTQPAFFHESAKMDENKGSAGAMTKNGNIILAPASSWS